ncbi:MAG: hypothetical protein FWH07_04800 [Oscillospiraceae bacterium]|nr:hypothetical protein [Oscillospiraceae bacterium]
MSNKPALIITATVALLAIVAVIFTINLLASDDNAGELRSAESVRSDADGEYTGDDIAFARNNDSEDYEFIPDEELEQEMHDAAGRLVRDNYEVFRLFYLVAYDLNSHFEPEPFNNPSEDGYRTLREDVIEYKTADEIFTLVDLTFIEPAAEVIKGFSSQTIGGNPVYKNRDGGIGVDESYHPKSYDLIWGDVEISLTFISEVEAIISATLHGNTVENESGEPEDIVKQMRMLKKEDGIWRLESIFF